MYNDYGRSCMGSIRFWWRLLLAFRWGSGSDRDHSAWMWIYLWHLVRTSETIYVFIVGSTGLGGPYSASESVASLDPCTVSPEVTEQGKHPQEARGPEGSPLPRSSLPWEQPGPSGSMPFTEGPLEGCLASSEAEAPQDGILTNHLRMGPSPNTPGDILPTFTPEVDGPTQHSMAARTPSAEGDKELKEEGQSSSSSCTGQLTGSSLVPLWEPRTEMLPGEGEGPYDFESATKIPAATQPGMQTSAVLESPPKLETMVPQDSVLRSSDRERGGAEVLTTVSAKNLKFLGDCHPAQSNSRANPGVGTSTASQESCQQKVEMHLPYAELSSDPLGLASEPADSGSCKETLDTSDAQSQPQTGTSGTEPQQVVCVAAVSQLDGSLLLSAEASPFTRTEKTHTASSVTAHPAAWNKLASEEPTETVSETKMSVSADLATTKQMVTGVAELKPTSDLRIQEQPEGSLLRVPAPFLQGLNDTTQEGLLLPTFSHGVSNESSRRSVGPTVGPKVPKNTENRVVAGEESRSHGDNPEGQQEATRTLAGAESGNHDEEKSQAFDGKPHLETEKDEVSKPHSNTENNIVPSSDSTQPLKQEVAGHMDGSHSGSAEIVGQVVAESQITDTATSLHKLHEENPILSSASDGTDEHFLPQEAIWESSRLQTKRPIMFQNRGGLEATESLPALESEKADFLPATAVEEVPKAGEMEDTLEVKKSHSPLHQPYSCDREGSLMSPDQPCGLEKVEPAQENHADASSPPNGKNSTIGHGLTMLSLEQDCQEKLSCPEDGLPPPSKNPLQPSQLDPEASISVVLCDKDQSPTNGQRACLSGPGLKKQSTDPSPTSLPGEGKPWADVSLSTQGGKEQGSGLPSKGSPCNIPSSSPKDTVLGGALLEMSDLSTPLGQKLPALGGNEQEDTGRSSQPSEILSSVADTSLTGNLGGKDSFCIGQGLSKSQQELADALKTGSQREEARRGDSGISEVSDVLPPPQGLDKTETASRNIVEAPPCPPDSVALLDTAHCSPDPVSTSPRVTPTQNALVSEACDESQKESASQPEMEQLATLGTEAQNPLGSFQRAEEQDAICGSSEVNVDAIEGDPGMQQASEAPEPALNSGFFQTDQSPISTLNEPCQVAQLEPSFGDALLSAGESDGLPRSTVGVLTRQTVSGPQSLLLAQPPEEIMPDTPYLHISGAARKDAENGSMRAFSSEDPGAPHESLEKEPPPALENDTPEKIPAVSTTVLQTGTAGGEISTAGDGNDIPQAGTTEGHVSLMPYLDRMPLLDRNEQILAREMHVAAVPEAISKPSEIAACPASEEAAGGTEGSRERAVELTPDLRVVTSGSEGAGSKQTSIIAGLPDFREHITKIFEQSVLGALAADRPHSMPSKKSGVPRSVLVEGPNVSLNSEKLLDGAQEVAAAPLPVLPAELQVEKKQESAVEAEVSHPVPQDPAPERLVGLVETALDQSLPGASVEGERTEEPVQGAQAHSQQELAVGIASSAAVQGVPAEKSPGFPMTPQSHADADGASAQGDKSHSVKEHPEALPSNSQHREDGAQDLAHTKGPSNLSGSTHALNGFPHGSVLDVPESNSEPWIPSTLGGERQIEAAVSTADMQNVLGNQDAPKMLAGEVSTTPLDPSKMAGAAEEAEGDVTPSSAETWACMSGDLLETGTTRMLPGVAGDSAQPGSCQDSGCSNRAQAMEDTATLQGDSQVEYQQAKEELGPQLPAPVGYGKTSVSSPPEPDESKDEKLHLLAPEELLTDRYLGAMPIDPYPHAK